MRNPKLVAHGSVLFITASVEADIIFPVNPLSELILLKCLAAAQELYPVRVCHFLVEGTHIHLLVIVDNPDDIKDFMAHFKRESAHAINRLLGREKRTVWCEGYDSPPVVSPERCTETIAYLYSNPAKDSLVDSIEEYPGLSSWDHFQAGKHVFHTFLVPRDEFRTLPVNHRAKTYNREARLLSKKKKKSRFTIYPDAWMEAFAIEESERAQINQRITGRVYQIEAEQRALREEEKRGVLGVKKLCETTIGTPYAPKRTGRRMICLGVNKEERARFIAHAKALFQRAREVYEEWKKGNTSIPYPPGLYPPSMPKLANVVGGLA